jgi:hypothetical protein
MTVDQGTDGGVRAGHEGIKKDDAAGAADPASERAIRFSKLIHCETGRLLQWDGKKVTSVSAEAAKDRPEASRPQGRFTSWRVEDQPDTGVALCRFRTAVDCETSQRYLVALPGGGIGVEPDRDDFDVPPSMAWRKQGSGKLMLYSTDQPGQCLFTDATGAVGTAKPLAGADRRFLWKLEAGRVDRSLWRSSVGQAGWSLCRHCGGVFWTGDPGRCMEGANRGRPHRAADISLILPLSDPFAKGEVTWRRCTRCSLLFDDALAHDQINWREFLMQGKTPHRNPVGVCWDGQAHAFDAAVSYTLPTDKSMVPNATGATSVTDPIWQRCEACHALVWGQGQGHCPGGKTPGEQHLEHLSKQTYVLRKWERPTWVERLLAADPVPFPAFDGALANTFHAFWKEFSRKNEALLNQLMKQGGPSDAQGLSGLRAAYPFLDPDLFNALNGAYDGVGDPPPEIDKKSWEEIRTQLKQEAIYGVLVTHYFSQADRQWERIFIKADLATAATQKILESEKPPTEAEVNYLDFIFSIFVAIAGVIPILGEETHAIAELVRAAIEVAEAATKLGIELSDGEDFAGREPLLVVEGSQYKFLSKRFDEQRTHLARLKNAILSDWGRLQAIQDRRLVTPDDIAGDPVADSWIAGYTIGLYQQLMPLRFCLIYAWSRSGEYFADEAQWLKKYLPDFPKGLVSLDERRRGLLQVLRKRPSGPGWTLKEPNDEWPSAAYMNELLGTRINPRGLLEGTAGWEGMERVFGAYHFHGGDGPAYYSFSVAQVRSIEKID